MKTNIAVEGTVPTVRTKNQSISLSGSPIWDPEFNGKTPAHVLAAAQAAQAIEAGAGTGTVGTVLSSHLNTRVGILRFLQDPEPYLFLDVCQELRSLHFRKLYLLTSVADLNLPGSE